MNIASRVLIFVAVISLSSFNQAANAEAYTNSNLPKLPEWAERKYQIVLSSISPDQNWAVLVPKDVEKAAGNFLVHLPDCISAVDLPTGAYFPDSSREYGLVVHWAKDSSAAAIYTNGKFGVSHLCVVVPGRPGYLIDLEHAIRHEMDGDFAASKATGWNEYYDYYLDDGAEGSWMFNANGQVVVDCQGDDNPREHPGLSWKGHFQGLYDISAEKFVSKKYERIFTGTYDTK